MAPDPDEETAGAGETNVHPPFAPKEGTEISGELDRIPIDDVLTTIFCARSTGTLTVAAQGAEPEGELVLWKGEPFACTVGRLTGDAAVLALLALRKGSFHFTEDIEPREQNVTRSIPELLAEARRA